MIFKYGSHTHTQGEVGLSVVKKALNTEAQTMRAHETTLSLNGMLVSQQANEASARAEIKLKQAALEAAYALENQDAILYMPDGTTETHHAYRAANMTGGVRVIQPPSFMEPQGVEGLTLSKYQIVLQAIVPIPTANLATALQSFQETVEFPPAGAKFGHLETKLGYPVKQQLRRRQIFRARQFGSAVGIYAYPSVPLPLWPFDKVNQEPMVTRGHPRRIGNDYVDYPISWQYDFESKFEMFGAPHIWGSTYP